MSAHERLTELCQQWQRLTEAEGQAIAHADWPQVDHCQSAKLELQQHVVSLTDDGARSRGAGDADSEAALKSLRPLVNELMRRESRNLELLVAQRAKLEKEKEDLGQATRNLRHVHRAYATPGESVWQSYS